MIFPDKNNNSLFDGNDKVFKELVSRASCYFEYGSGLSTQWVIGNTRADVVSVETSLFWINEIKKSLGEESRWRPIYVNVGPLGDWGRPLGFRFRSRFLYYAASPWRLVKSPEVILIDGRFRVLCFLVCLLNAKAGTKIIFDDYLDREYYHVCGEFLKPVWFIGRQAIFQIPNYIRAKERVRRDIVRFSYVVD